MISGVPLNPVAVPVKVPLKFVAVISAIPVISVELSPTIFPFAVILFVTVNESRVPTEVMLGCAAVVIIPL